MAAGNPGILGAFEGLMKRKRDHFKRPETGLGRALRLDADCSISTAEGPVAPGIRP